MSSPLDDLPRQVGELQGLVQMLRRQSDELARQVQTHGTCLSAMQARVEHLRDDVMGAAREGASEALGAYKARTWGAFFGGLLGGASAALGLDKFFKGGA